jgi:hypothetical protein
LEIVCLRGEEDEYPEYPKSLYYIINLESGRAFWVDSTYCDLARDKIITRKIFSTSEALKQYLAKGTVNIILENRYAQGVELQPLPKELKFPDLSVILQGNGMFSSVGVACYFSSASFWCF